MFRKSMLAVLVFGLFMAMVPTVAAQTRCFPSNQSPHCLSDPFSGYWESNGGLPVFGYPITSAAKEGNRDTGQVYLTQWLERNRFELHPENTGTPYEVMLGLLGKERLAQLGRNWASEPKEAGAKAGCLWFKETGRNVCNQSGNLGFKSYWENNGLEVPGLDRYARSLQLFGFPLTSPKMERNEAGDLVMTQWFERARFEWHPNNPDEYKVLLGLLGKEVYANGGGGATPGPDPAPINDSCTMNAPAEKVGAQTWTTRNTVAPGGQQTLCARLTSTSGHRSGVSVTFKVDVGAASTSYIGITDTSGVAKVQVRVGSTTGRADVTATFSSGEQAQTSFRIQ